MTRLSDNDTLSAESQIGIFRPTDPLLEPVIQPTIETRPESVETAIRLPV